MEITCWQNRLCSKFTQKKKKSRSLSCASFKTFRHLFGLWLGLLFDLSNLFRTVWSTCWRDYFLKITVLAVNSRLFQGSCAAQTSLSIWRNEILRFILLTSCERRIRKTRRKRGSPCLVLLKNEIIYVPTSLVYVKANSLRDCSFFFSPPSR